MVVLAFSREKEIDSHVRICVHMMTDENLFVGQIGNVDGKIETESFTQKRLPAIDRREMYRISMRLWIACGLSHIRILNGLCPRSSGISLRLRGEPIYFPNSNQSIHLKGARIRTDTLAHWSWNYFIRMQSEKRVSSVVILSFDTRICAAKHLEMFGVNNTCSATNCLPYVRSDFISGASIHL